MPDRPEKGQTSSQPSGDVMALDQRYRGIMPLVMRAFYYSRRAFDEAMRSHNITGSQAGVLSRIYEHPGISGAEISRQMGTTPQAVHLMLATLERKGLIEREPDPSQGRVVSSHLTQAGQEVFLACLSDAAAVERGLSKHLSSTDRHALIELLERYLAPTLPAGANELASTDGIGRKSSSKS